MGWLSSIFQLIMAIPSLIKTFNEVMAWVDKWNRANQSKQDQAAVDETTRTGNQTAEEIATGGVGGGASHDPLPGMKTRPPQDHT